MPFFSVTCGSYSDFKSNVGMEVVVDFFKHLITNFPLELKVKPYVLPPRATGKHQGEERLTII